MLTCAWVRENFLPPSGGDMAPGRGGWGQSPRRPVVLGPTRRGKAVRCSRSQHFSPRHFAAARSPDLDRAAHSRDAHGA